MSGFRTIEMPRPRSSGVRAPVVDIGMVNGELAALRSEVATLRRENARLRDIIDSANPRRVRTGANAIIAEVAERHRLTVDDIMGKSRAGPVVRARWEAIAAVATARPTWSLPRLGMFFGGKDHSTISHALEKMGIQRSQYAESQP